MTKSSEFSRHAIYTEADAMCSNGGFSKVSYHNIQSKCSKDLQDNKKSVHLDENRENMSGTSGLGQA